MPTVAASDFASSANFTQPDDETVEGRTSEPMRPVWPDLCIGCSQVSWQQHSMCE